MALIKENSNSFQSKDIDILISNSKFWIVEFLHVEKEIEFLKKILKSFPFKENTPNLFEKIELFNKDFNSISSEKKILTEKLSKHQSLLQQIKIPQNTDKNNLLITEYNITEKKVKEFFNKYKKVKEELYEYILGIIT